MKTINDVIRLANDMLDEKFTIKTLYSESTISARELGYYFEFDNCKNSFGRCFYNKKITLSLPLCEVNLDKVDTRIRNTVLHEMAHAFSHHIYGRNGQGHGVHWKDIARQIGCDAKRCFDGNSVNVPKPKYALVCDNCNKETYRYKKTTRSYACGKCCNEHSNGKFNEKYKLRLVVNQ